MGDIAPSLHWRGLQASTVSRATTGARTEQAMALSDLLSQHAHGDVNGNGDGSTHVLAEVQTLLAGASVDDVKALRRLLFQTSAAAAPGRAAVAKLASGWRDGRYLYKHLLSRQS